MPSNIGRSPSCVSHAAGRVSRAIAELDVRVLVTTGPGGGATVGLLPSNVHAQEWVDQPDAMGRAAAVVCHGGSGTVLGALSAGVPMVIVAMVADHPVNACRVVEAGAGLLLEQPRSSAIQRATLDDSAISRLRLAVQEVLADHRYRRAAG